jgi:hypothetical protein
MATLGRNFREIDLGVTSTQSGRQRFPPSDPEDPPTATPWRNNLTCLSQTRNIYFVAYGDEIYAYRPSFPAQRIDGKRVFRWVPAPTGSDRNTQRATSRHAHGINRMLVSEFGEDEVISTAHDEGDYIVATVKSVARAIGAVERGDISEHEAAIKYIRYVHRSNVGDSAWGLATHKQARLLAVSANHPKIFVYIPALVRQAGATTEVNVSRMLDRQMSLSGHENNVPSIAFCNTGADPDGQYLISTDIDGSIMIWDIWKRQGIKKITVSVTGIDSGDEFLGWSVTCIDPKHLHEVDSDYELLGYERHLQNLERSTNLVVTERIRYLRDHNVNHPLYSYGRVHQENQHTAVHDIEGLSERGRSEDEEDEDDEDDEDNQVAGDTTELNFSGEPTSPTSTEMLDDPEIVASIEDMIRDGHNLMDVEERLMAADPDIAEHLGTDEHYDVVDVGPQFPRSRTGPGPRSGNLVRDVPQAPQEERRSSSQGGSLPLSSSSSLQTPHDTSPRDGLVMDQPIEPRYNEPNSVGETALPFGYNIDNVHRSVLAIPQAGGEEGSELDEETELAEDGETDTIEDDIHEYLAAQGRMRGLRRQLQDLEDLMGNEGLTRDRYDEARVALDMLRFTLDMRRGAHGASNAVSLTEASSPSSVVTQRTGNSPWTRPSDSILTRTPVTPSARNTFQASLDDTPSPLTRKTSRTTPIRANAPTTDPISSIPFSIIQTGERVVTLLRPPFDDVAAVCFDPCHQHLPPTWDMLRTFDRLSLTAHIPELGIIVTGTQMGRAAVFSLVGRKRNPPQQNKIGYGYQAPKNTSRPLGLGTQAYQQHNGTYGRSKDTPSREPIMQGTQAMRLDWVLPLQSQEVKGERPAVPLIGLAAGPVQGHMNDEGVTRNEKEHRDRKFRLLMTYQDHTVLAYELWRGGAKGFVGVEELVY